MFHNKFILSCMMVLLAYSSTDAMKRSLENGKDGVERLPKRIKLVCPEEATPVTKPRTHKGMFYCERDIYNCSFVTKFRRKIEEHHALHDAPSAFSCRKCDYLGATNHCVSNHASRWHAIAGSKSKAGIVELVVKKSMSSQVSSSLSEDLVLPINEKKECAYCGREGNNMKSHMEVYHKPKFGKRSYFQCFSLYRPVALPAPSQSSSGTESE